VPDPTVHDDLLISGALVAVLDKQDWGGEYEGEVIRPDDNWGQAPET
jgi:hypothetical protein